MDFSLTQDQQHVRELAAKILADQTENEHLREIEQTDGRTDLKLWDDLAQAGLLGVAIDEQYGGMGFGFETLCLLIEEIGRSVAPVPVVTSLITAYALEKYTTQAAEYLAPVSTGEQILTSAFIEPESASMSHPNTCAIKINDQWLINGEKHAVAYANQAKAVVITAKIDQELAVFLLEPQSEGVVLIDQEVTSHEPQQALRMHDVRAQLVARGQQADAFVQHLQQYYSAALCAFATGLADKMMRMTASYTADRHQFGVPIATFQAVGHRAADCFIDVECLRSVTQQAVSLLNAGADATEAVLVAKIWAGDVLHRVSQSAQHLHGGTGVDREYPLFRYCLWARQLELTMGSSAMLTQSLGEHIGTHVLKDDSASA